MHRTRGHRVAFWSLVALVTLWVSPFVVQVYVPGLHHGVKRLTVRWAGEMADVHNPDVVNHYTHLALSRLSFAGHGQYPWRTHLVGGGTFLAGHPRDVTLSPFAVPAYLLGDALGLKVTAMAMYYIGALGMFYLCRRRLGMGPMGAFFAGALLVTTPWLPMRLNSGNYDEWHFMLFPLVLAFFLQARRTRRYLIGAGMLLFPVVIDGKYILPIMFLYLGLFTAAEVARGTWRRLPGWGRRAVVWVVLLLILLVADFTFSLPQNAVWIGYVALVATFELVRAQVAGPPPVSGLSSGPLAVGGLLARSRSVSRRPRGAARAWGRRVLDRLRRWGDGEPAAQPLGLKAPAALVVVAALVLVLAAVKIVPMMSVLRTDDRTRADRYAAQNLPKGWPALGRFAHLPQIGEGFTRLGLTEMPPRNLDIRWLGVGPSAVAVALLGLLLRPRRAAGWLLFLFASLWLTLWYRMPLDPMYLLDHLPLFRSINSPDKYFNWGILFALCVMGGHCVSALERPRKVHWKLIAAAFVLVAVGEPLAYTYHVQQRLFRRGPIHGRRMETFYPVVARDPARDLHRQYRDYYFVTRGIGIINWYCPLDLPRAAVPKFFIKALRKSDRRGDLPKTVLPLAFEKTPNPAYRNEAHFLKPGNACEIEELTPNRLRIAVHLDTPDTLVINQNDDHRWRTDRGTLTATTMDTPAHLLVGLGDPKAGPLTYDRTRRTFRQLAVRLAEPGHYTVTLRYRPWDAYVGAVISGVAWLVCVVILLRAALRRRTAAVKVSGTHGSPDPSDKVEHDYQNRGGDVDGRPRPTGGCEPVDE